MSIQTSKPKNTLKKKFNYQIEEFMKQDRIIIENKTLKENNRILNMENDKSGVYITKLNEEIKTLKSRILNTEKVLSDVFIAKVIEENKTLRDKNHILKMQILVSNTIVFWYYKLLVAILSRDAFDPLLSSEYMQFMSYSITLPKNLFETLTACMKDYSKHLFLNVKTVPDTYIKNVENLYCNMSDRFKLITKHIDTIIITKGDQMNKALPTSLEKLKENKDQITSVLNIINSELTLTEFVNIYATSNVYWNFMKKILPNLPINIDKIKLDVSNPLESLNSLLDCVCSLKKYHVCELHEFLTELKVENINDDAHNVSSEFKDFGTNEYLKLLDKNVGNKKLQFGIYNLLCRPEKKTTLECNNCKEIFKSGDSIFRYLDGLRCIKCKDDAFYTIDNVLGDAIKIKPVHLVDIKKTLNDVSKTPLFESTLFIASLVTEFDENYKENRISVLNENLILKLLLHLLLGYDECYDNELISWFKNSILDLLKK
jgi:hypothetical protein